MLKLTILAFGEKCPSWIEEGTKFYGQRLKEHVQLNLVELPIEKRTKNQSEAVLKEREAKKLEMHIPPSCYLIALDSQGRHFSSEGLAQKLEQVQHQTSHLCLLIGGPDGLSNSILSHCQESWSLSSLTFPHPLARVILLETLYRSFSILQGHPYHRA